MELKVSQKKGVDIQKDLIGIFFEDINYGADGGIYAEMIENRSFEFLDARGDRDNYTQIFDGMYGWNAFPQTADIKLEISRANPLNDINPHFLHVEAKSGNGFSNKAYDGVYLEKGNKYNVSFYARCEKDTEIEIAVMSGDKKAGSGARVVVKAGEWNRYEAVLTGDEEVRNGLFTITLVNDGVMDFDCISMMPQDAVCGVFRKDLVEKLEELSPKFIRFPGGCVVEGNELTNRYQWKLSVGDIAERKWNWNRWAVHDNNKENDFHSKYSHYNQSLGLGYYEYFLLCEHLGAKALPVANVGLACQYMSSELVTRDDERYQDFIQDVLDLIEFANGDETTKWGSLRAQMGHKAPFNLELVGIGNEQWQTEKVDFFERYDDFEKAIHERYPDIKLIGSAGPTVHTPTYEAAWKNYYEKAPKIANYTYAVDEHYYMEPDWFLKNTHFYDNYDRSVKVFSGEYAAHDNEVKQPELRNNFRCALSEAAFLTGVERNADVVYLSSYAPLFARLGYVQWAPDLIWFDDKESYGTPSFYVQKLFSHYTGTHTLESSIADGEENGVFHSVSKDENTGHTYIKLINSSTESKEIAVDLTKAAKITKIVMTAEPFAVNSIDNPDNVAPKTVDLQPCSSVELPAYSVVVLDVE